MGEWTTHVLAHVQMRRVKGGIGLGEQIVGEPIHGHHVQVTGFWRRLALVDDVLTKVGGNAGKALLGLEEKL